MKDIEIEITKSTRFVDFKTEVIGNDGESLQSKLIFTFKDEFVDGQARLEYEINCEKYYAPLEKIRESYEIPIKSVMTKQGSINMQLVITQGTDENEIPIFKSNKFFLTCNESINAEIEQPEEYPDWIDIANTKLNEVDNLNIEMQDSVVTITRKDGTQYSENVKGDNYVITEEDYNVIENQVKIDIQPILEEIENVSKQAEIIAKGRATGYVFDTLEELNNWLLVEENTSKLVLGDNLYIRTVGVPDYWWDGSSKQVLETEKPDLTEYAKKEQFVTLTQAEYDALTEKSANTYYFIIEEE